MRFTASPVLEVLDAPYRRMQGLFCFLFVFSSSPHCQVIARIHQFTILIKYLQQLLKTNKKSTQKQLKIAKSIKMVSRISVISTNMQIAK